jgi:hypothetical protein
MSTHKKNELSDGLHAQNFLHVEVDQWMDLFLIK